MHEFVTSSAFLKGGCQLKDLRTLQDRRILFSNDVHAHARVRTHRKLVPRPFEATGFLEFSW
jgi:hypothetical protein